MGVIRQVLGYNMTKFNWIHEENFNARYSKTNLLADKILTEDSGIYISGGATSQENVGTGKCLNQSLS